MPTNQQKRVEIPIRTHIWKFMQVHAKWDSDGTLNCGLRRYPIKTNNTSGINKYMNHTDGKIITSTLICPSSIYHQYAMVQHYEKLFFEHLSMYVDVRKEYHKVFNPLREFLQIYDITYDDYDFDSAWKRYQREIVRRKTKTKAVYEQHK